MYGTRIAADRSSTRQMAGRFSIACQETAFTTSATTTRSSRAESLGNEFREQLQVALSPYEMVKEIRGQGMLTGIEFQAPGNLGMRMSFEAFKAIDPGLFGQLMVMRLFNDTNILTQICGNNFMVLKVAPPLTISEQQVQYCVDSIRSVIETVHSKTFWSEAIALARRAMSA